MSEAETKTEETTNSTSTPVVEAKPTVTISMPADWSWGGFMFGPAYFIAVKKYEYLLIYLLMFIPIVNFIAMIGIAIYLGMKGHTLVATSTMFANDAERAGFNHGIDHAGKIMFILVLISFVLAFIFAGLFVGMMATLFGGPHMFR